MQPKENHCMPFWNRVVIIGVGMLGGSIALALRQRGLAGCIAGTGRNLEKLEQWRRAGMIDECYTSIEPAALDADLVIACTPVQCIASDLLAASQWAKPSTLLTDVGSTKQAIVSELEGKIRKGLFVGSHPLAGSEKSGAEHSKESLLEKRLVLITPTNSTHPEAIQQATALWSALGANVREIPAQKHDDILAQTSHLPHLIASALAAQTSTEHLDFVAAGWRDCTRIAGGDPELWCQILRENRLPVLRAVENFAKVLSEWQSALELDQPDQILNLLSSGKSIRDQAVGN
jgi:prephenate dehydrogenase